MRVGLWMWAGPGGFGPKLFLPRVCALWARPVHCALDSEGRPVGDLTHAMVQLDESAIARNVGRDLAFAASRLAARCHPGVGGCAAPSSLVIFGISQPNARWTEG